MPKRSNRKVVTATKDKAEKQASKPPSPSGVASVATAPASLPFLANWSSLHSYVLLTAATILSLAPFSGKAFHVDDTLFLFAAKQIVQHPFDPYGFQLVWNTTAERMSDVTKNPPLACYYAALVGRIAGWSERALHLAFLIPALGLVLGTYRLAKRCTRFPLLASFAVLLTPGVLVSATSVMCDTMMVALWIWAVIFWVEGLEPVKPWYLLSSSLLIAASGLTKYFGVALIPLLFVYSLMRLRRLGWWAAWFLIPISLLLGYELWSSALYGQGLIGGAAQFAGSQREFQQGSTMAHMLISLSFAGGCTLTALTLLPLLWSRKYMLAGAVLSVLAATALGRDWVTYGVRVGGPTAAKAFYGHWVWIAFQLTLCIISGVSIIAVAITDVWKHKRSAESWLLALWVLGTWIFTGFVNWTVNARSVLPLIPAAGILMLRRMEEERGQTGLRNSLGVTAAALAIAGLCSFWITIADVDWANSAREAANQSYQKTRNERGAVFFLGHWGFQYYMQGFGFTPGDELNSQFHVGDLVIVPKNNTELVSAPRQFNFVAQENVELLPGMFVTTMNPSLGAGFYSSYWGPLPFAFGNVPPEIYHFGRVMPAHR